jgi:tol-pal system protein YbgF
MIDLFCRAVPMTAAVLVLAALPVQAQDASEGVSGRLESLQRDTSGFFGQLFGGSERFDRRPGPAQPGPAQATPVEMAQLSPAELVTRLDRLENQIRQLTGLVEQLQYRNQQLETQVRRMQEGGAPPPMRQEGTAPPVRPVQPGQPGTVPGPYTPPPRRSEAIEPGDGPGPAGRPVGRRPDVFDPSESPNAPGAPRVLGTIPGGPNIITGDPDPVDAGPAIGVPGGRQVGAPLDLSTLSGHAANDPALAPGGGPPGAPMGGLPPPPPRTPSATGAYQLQAAVPPGTSPKDEYDLAYGYLVRRDYAVADDNFRAFLRKYPGDRMVAEANYWLGESLFQRQRFREAAESFLTVSTKFEKSTKAPDALVRLGQSLAALKEKEAACATFVEVGRKYPRASPSVKQSVEREQKRVGC